MRSMGTMYYKVLSTGRVENIDLAEIELLRRALAPAAALPRHLAHQRGPRILQQSVAAPRLLLSCVVSFVAHSLCDASRTLRLPRSAPCAALRRVRRGVPRSLQPCAVRCTLLRFCRVVSCTLQVAPARSVQSIPPSLLAGMLLHSTTEQAAVGA